MRTVDDVRLAYCPFGYRRNQVGRLLLAFNAERWCELIGAYMLGNGVRAYSPTLKRFKSPDSLSPFERGGINSYSYCGGDPVNRSDPSGKMFKSAHYKYRSNTFVDVHRRELYGTNLKQKYLMKLDEMDNKQMGSFLKSGEPLALDGLQRVTRNAFLASTSSSAKLPSVGLLKSDADFIADNIVFYRRRMEIHQQMSRIPEYQETKRAMEIGVERFRVIAERRLGALQGKEVIDSGDPEFTWLSEVISALRLAD